jgi:HD-like signal output (HDOD) protein
MNSLVLASASVFLALAIWLVHRARTTRARKADGKIADGSVAEAGRNPVEDISPVLSEPKSGTIGPVSIEALRKVIPLRKMSDEELTALASEQPPRRFAAGSLVFREGETANRIYCLLEGTLCLETRRGDRQVIRADSPRAQKPLNAEGRHAATARAQTDILVIGLAHDMIEKVAAMDAPAKQEHLDLRRLTVPESLADSSLFYVFRRTFEEDKLELPTLPTVAFKLRKAINEDVNIEEAAKIVQMDPVIASKLIQVANCPLYLTAHPATTCQSAIIRLGLATTRNLIFTISMRQMFNAGKAQSHRLLEMWKHSLYVSVLSSVLASRTRRIDPDKALLGGLICKIGAIPLVHFAEKLPPDSYTENELEAAVEVVQGPVGHYLLGKWDFPAEYVELPLFVQEWQHDSGTRLDLSDIVRLALWHSYVGTPKMAELPPITDLPAYGKLDDDALTPENSLQLLHDAKDLIGETYRIFQ